MESTLFYSAQELVKLEESSADAPNVGGRVEEEELHPTPDLAYSSRTANDKLFSILFYASLLLLYLIGIDALWITWSLLDIPETVFAVIRGTFNQLLTCSGLVIVLGFCWIYFVRIAIKPMILLMVVSVPILSVCISIWSFIEARADKTDGKFQVDWLYTTSAASAVVGVLFTWWIHKKRKRIEKSAQVMQLAVDMIMHNKSVVGISFLLLVVYSLFAASWLAIFSRLFVLGHMENSNWIVDDYRYVCIAYFLFVFLWTSAIIKNLQRATISGIVTHWYFNRSNDPLLLSDTKSSIQFLQQNLTLSFGSICLGSLISSVVASVRLFGTAIKRMVRFIPFIDSGLLCIGVLEGFVDYVNKYAFCYIGMTGEGFCYSSHKVTGIFRQHLIFGLISDLIVQQILLLSLIGASTFSGFASYGFATHTFQSPYAFVVGFFGTYSSYSLLRFFYDILLDTIDAACLCFAVDLQSDQVTYYNAHVVFKSL